MLAASAERVLEAPPTGPVVRLAGGFPLVDLSVGASDFGEKCQPPANPTRASSDDDESTHSSNFYLVRAGAD